MAEQNRMPANMGNKQITTERVYLHACVRVRLLEAVCEQCMKKQFFASFSDCVTDRCSLTRCDSFTHKQRSVMLVCFIENDRLCL